MSLGLTSKVIVGMSGGVDSSVAALLLLEQAYRVEGVFMKNWEGDDDEAYCPATQDLADAEAVCARLGIPLHRVNFSAAYRERVFRHFLSEYQAGRTPNPDILCNREIKFKAFLDFALAQGADAIATGHYARRVDHHGAVELHRGIDMNKDQSYFLYTLGQAQLPHVLFPIGDYEKPFVRQLAEQHHLITHNKKDSTGICFIGERKFKQFLNEYVLAQPGDIEDQAGNRLGRHDGLMFYTYGQRQGLRLGGLKNAPELPWYVAGKDIKRNVLIVVQGHDHPLLFSQGLSCAQMSWVSGCAPEFPLECTAKTRYRQTDHGCIVTATGSDRLTVMFSEKQRAITPGQSIVFYQGPKCLGGGVIETFVA